MLNERKLTERELDKRIEAIKGLLSNKRSLVKKYGKDAEKVMYGIATKQAKKKVENMNLDNLKELIKKSIQKKAGTTTVDTGFSGRADYGEEDRALGREDELEMTGLEENYADLSPEERKKVGTEYDYEDIGQAYIENMGRPHSLTNDELEYLGKRIVKQLYKGDIAKAYDEIVMYDKKLNELYKGASPDEMIKIIKMMNPEAQEKFLKKLAKIGKGRVNENSSQDDAVYELRNIVDQIEQLSDDAKETIRNYFPNELSRLEAYGVFDMIYSNNRYDVTLGKLVDRLESGDYDDLDDDDYVNEDLDVGHQDDEPGMLKRELARAGQMVQMLYRAIDKYDDQGEVDFPQWWQSKIIKANDYLDSAFDYLDGEEMVAKIDAVLDMSEEVTKPEEKKLKKISKELDKASKMHKSQSDRISKIVKEKLSIEEEVDIPAATMMKVANAVTNVKTAAQVMIQFYEELAEKEKVDFETNAKFKLAINNLKTLAQEEEEEVSEKLTKKHKVDDFVDDFKKSDAPQFKGKSAEKKRKMAVAAYLSKQND